MIKIRLGMFYILQGLLSWIFVILLPMFFIIFVAKDYSLCVRDRILVWLDQVLVGQCHSIHPEDLMNISY